MLHFLFLLPAGVFFCVDQSPLFVQLISVDGENKTALMDEDDPVCNLLQVAGDVGREQDSLLSVLHKALEKVHQLIPDHRIQAAGGFVKNQQRWIMGERIGNLCLGLHAL